VEKIVGRRRRVDWLVGLLVWPALVMFKCISHRMLHEKHVMSKMWVTALRNTLVQG